MLAAALALIPILGRYIPDIVGWLGGDDAEQVAGQVVAAVTAVAGSTDPAVVATAITDPARSADLALGLAKISAEREAAKDANRLATLQAALADTANARGQTAALAAAGSKIAYAAPVMSVIIVAGFFVCIIMLFVVERTWDERTSNLMNILFGVLTAGFTQVTNYWLGASRDNTVREERNNAVQGAALAMANATTRQVLNSAPAAAAAAATAATSEAVRPLFTPRG